MKTVWLLALLLVLAGQLCAQEVLTGVTYNMALPSTETTDFVDETSFRGFGFEARAFSRNNLSVGVSLNWNVFSEVTDELISVDHGHVSGTQRRMVYAVPVMASAHYYFRDPWSREKVIPYAGIGGGAYRIEEILEIGVFEVIEDSWHFGLAPEVGMMVPLADLYAMVNLKYNYAFEGGGQQPHSYWGINVGIYDFP